MTDVHVIYVYVLVLVAHSEDVDIVDGLRDDDALGTVTCDEVILLLQLLRFLETEFERQPFHLCAQVVEQFGCIASQDGADAVDVGTVLLGRDESDATSFAPFQMIVETETTLAGTYIFGRY